MNADLKRRGAPGAFLNLDFGGVFLWAALVLSGDERIIFVSEVMMLLFSLGTDNSEPLLFLVSSLRLHKTIIQNNKQFLVMTI